VQTLQVYWYRFWLKRRHWRSRGARVRAHLESPLPGQPFRQHLLVRGAVRTSSTGPVHLTCSVNGQPVSSWTLDQDPEGVRFEAVVPERNVPSGRWLWLRLVATSGNDGGTVLLDSYPIRRTRKGGPRIPRHEYGRVWDREAVDRASARTAVAGYSDDAEWQRSGESTAVHVSEMLGLSETSTVLEIGCGAGRVGARMAPRVKAWIGADTSARMLEYAREALAGQANASFVHLNGYDLHGVDAASLDAVYCTTVFMHLDEWDRYRYVEEAFRVLKPGGRLYIDNFDLRSPEGWRLFLEMAKLDPAVRPANVSRSSTAQELLWYVEKAGFIDPLLEEGQVFVTVTARKPAGR
jgi:ubiquinone/menaquinone biosynthesis C-methylase UbiE